MYYQAQQPDLFPEVALNNKKGRVITNDEALQILKDEFEIDIQVIFDALIKADGNFNLKSNMNSAKGIARWGDINQFIGEQIILQGYSFNVIKGQPTLINKEKNIQIIIMAGDNNLGDIDVPITAKCVKGYATQEKIALNQIKDNIQTWILYYPSKDHIIYEQDNPNLIFEIAKPTSYQIVDDGKVFPIDHVTRLIFISKGEIQSYSSEFADEAINEDSFDIGYKLTGNNE